MLYFDVMAFLYFLRVFYFPIVVDLSVLFCFYHVMDILSLLSVIVLCV